MSKRALEEYDKYGSIQTKSLSYTIKDVLEVGNPLDDGSQFKCVHCKHNGYVKWGGICEDFYCEWCGNWQQEEAEELS